MSQGLIKAEKNKEKKDFAKKRPASSCFKKAHIKSQNTIQEEEALSKIVSKAWTTVEVKKQKEI